MARPRKERPQTSRATHDLCYRAIGDFDPLPADRPAAPVATRSLLEQILNPAAPLQTGTYTPEGGWERDETDEDREAKKQLVAEIQRQRSGR
jgi:hypothetical protein